MAAQQLKTSNNGQVNSMTIILSEKMKTVAHSGDKWKAGYLTLSHLSPGKNTWRNVHLSKRSFEKMCEKVERIETGLKNQTNYQLMLNKKQHLSVTRFQREGHDTLFYLSLLHPTSEQEFMTSDINHSKTINMNMAEFDTLKNNLKDLIQVVRTKVEKPDERETPLIDGFRWRSKNEGLFQDLPRHARM